MDLLRRYYEEMWNAWNFDLASELLTSDFRFRGSFGVEIVGTEAFKGYMRLVQSAFPDFHNRIERSLNTPNEVVAQLTYSGTHKGDFLGIPGTGRRVTYPGIAIFNRKGPKFSAGYVVGDRAVLIEAILGRRFWRAHSEPLGSPAPSE
jgi:steroid delta-isomerase-like uncharacterized protein